MAVDTTIKVETVYQMLQESRADLHTAGEQLVFFVSPVLDSDENVMRESWKAVHVGDWDKTAGRKDGAIVGHGESKGAAISEWINAAYSRLCSAQPIPHTQQEAHGTE